MPLGALQIDFVANIATYIADLGKVNAQTEATARRIEKSLNGAFDSIKTHALGLATALGVGFSLKGLEELVTGAIEAEAHLAEIGARAGVSGSEISKLSLAAKLSHTDLSDLADMSAKLSKALLSSQDSGSKQEAVFKALGFSSRDTARLLADPVGALQEISKALNALPEGGTKSAAGLLLIGRGGSAASAAMAELAKQTTLVATRTDDEVRAAKDFEDSLIQMRARSDNLKTQLANALLPTLSDVVDALTKLTTGAGGAKDILDGLAKSGSIKEWARDGAIAVAVLAESLLFVGKNARLVGNDLEILITDLGIVKGGLTALGKTAADPTLTGDSANKEINDLRSLLERRRALIANEGELEANVWRNNTKVSDALKAQFAKSDAPAEATGFAGGSADAVQRRIDAAAARAKAVQNAVRDANNRGSGGASGDIAKKELDNQLAALNASIELEKQALSARDEYLSAYYAHGDISIHDFYEKRNEAISEGLAFQEHAFDAEIIDVQTYVQKRLDELKKLQASGAIKPDSAAKDAEAAQEDATKRIIEITKRRELAEGEAAKQGVKNWFDERQAAEDYLHSLNDISAQLLTLQGNTAAAAAITFQDSHEKQRRQLEATASGLDPLQSQLAQIALDQVNSIQRATILQAQLNDKSRDFATINDQISNSVEHLNLQYQLGGATELETINKTADAINAKIASLSALAETYAKLARDAGNTPTGLAYQNQTDQLRLRIEALVVQADALNKKFRDIFVGATTTFLDDLLNRTKSVKDAFVDFGKSIGSSIGHIASQNIAEQLFAKSGPLGGVSEFFGGLFGGKGATDAATGVATNTSVATLGTAATETAGLIAATDAPLIAFVSSISAASAAADAFAASAAAGSATNAAGGIANAFAAASVYEFGGAATGGEVTAAGYKRVGELGPEDVYLPKGAQVIPNSAIKNRGGGSIHYHGDTIVQVNVPQGTGGPTANQIGRTAGQAVTTAQRRFG